MKSFHSYMIRSSSKDQSQPTLLSVAARNADEFCMQTDLQHNPGCRYLFFCWFGGRGGWSYADCGLLHSVEMWPSLIDQGSVREGLVALELLIVDGTHLLADDTSNSLHEVGVPGGCQANGLWEECGLLGIVPGLPHAMQALCKEAQPHALWVCRWQLCALCGGAGAPVAAAEYVLLPKSLSAETGPKMQDFYHYPGHVTSTAYQCESAGETMALRINMYTMHGRASSKHYSHCICLLPA